MQAYVDKFRKDVATLEQRANGRVTPAMLSPVRVAVPEYESADGRGVKLEEVATVGVRDGTTLIVTVFEEQTLKHVEKALYDAKLPGVVPQKADSRTIKIPIPKPTVETRLAMFSTAQRQAEDTRVLIRKQHQASVKKGGYEKHAPEIKEFQTLLDKFLAEVDKILAEAKKSSGAK
ncbi:hypothetical protein CERSUDRAFT_54801 [Gelatoporia subvermispora B]|uniref:Ribosome recycling factor domain-containing protein n=1 Tax=Ceriporiopsis subvermispora (strain B) TaxID=914234 RepID=M2R7Y8_CERS8|nr:hypothetical protein CERSUDRAFT_54801 [Gelatoporia subvermispora B]